MDPIPNYKRFFEVAASMESTESLVAPRALAGDVLRGPGAGGPEPGLQPPQVQADRPQGPRPSGAWGGGVEPISRERVKWK